MGVSFVDPAQRYLSPGLLRFLDALSAEAAQSGITLYLVGGLLRDLRLGRATLDIDVVLEGDAPPFAQQLQRRFGGSVVVHAAFRTAVWRLSPELIATYDLPIGLDHLDFATARHETYPTPAALPVVQPGTFTEDLARRDFTINTLAARLPGWEGIDLQGGLADLENGVIRTLHARSFEDDPTRIFRAIRYQTRLDFHLDPLTRKQLIEGIPLIDRLTGERVQHELLKMLREDSALGMLLNLDRVGVWRQLDRGLPDSTRLALVFEGMSQAVALFGECDETLRLTVILAAAVMPERVIRRLHFLEALTPVEKCVGVTERLRLQPTQPSGWVRALDGCDAGVLRILYVLNPEHREGIGRYWREWRHIKPSLTGADLKKMGLQPSPLFGKILGGLRDALVDKRITTSEDERRLLTQWIASGYPE